MADQTVLASAALIQNFEAQQGIPQNALVDVMIIESGLKPSAKNSTSGASGLIQFMPNLLASWGYSAAQVRNMSIVEQLPLVVKYFSPYMAKLRNQADPFEYYCAVFYPASIGQPDSFIIAKKGTAVYNQNSAYAQNGAITKGSIRQVFYEYVNKFKVKTGLTADVKKKSANDYIGNAADYVTEHAASIPHNISTGARVVVDWIFNNGR